MRRRNFIKGIVGLASVWPLATWAQQETTPVVGFLNGGAPDGDAPLAAAFRQGLQESGYVEGRNVTIEYRWADGRMDQLAAMANDLVRRKVAVIAGTSAPGALAAKAATSTIPIIFETGEDPVKLGLWRQHYWRHSTERGGRSEATGVAARAGPHGDCHGAARQSGKSYYREVIE
jgi:putative ABC transport system substrate-binding protein